MAQEICDEIKRLQRRKQLRLASGAAASCSSSSGSEGDASPPHHSSHNVQKVHNRALFTFKQVKILTFLYTLRKLIRAVMADCVKIYINNWVDV